LRLWDRGPEIDRLERIGPRRDPISKTVDVVRRGTFMRLRRRFAWFYVRLDLSTQISSRLSAYTVFRFKARLHKPPKPNPIDVAMKYI
jgi:hypothetical protein